MLFTPRLTPQDIEVAGQLDELWNGLRYQLGQPRRWHGSLRRIIAAKNIQGSNSIEGYHVSVEDAVALLDGADAVESNETDAEVVRNYGDAMTYIVTLADDPQFHYDATLIRSLHYMMMKHDVTVGPGHFRTGPVRVVRGAETLYEGPDAADVHPLVQELCDQLNTAAVDSHWIEAAMAHLNLVMIHPFKDGNGRMSRALQTLVLAKARIQSPVFLSIEEYLGANTPNYYRVLLEVGGPQWDPDRDPTAWIRFNLTAHHRQAQTIQRRLTESARLWEAIDDLRAEHSLDERTTGVLYSAAWGFRVRRRDHQAYAIDISDRVANLDLAKLVDVSLLRAVGERRGRHYVAAPALTEIRERT
ncbi:MAG: Fic family protein, partial [Acidimicrobiia bacterium]